MTVNFFVLTLQSVTIRRAISKNHKASLISELCHDVSQKYTKATGEVDVSLILLQAPALASRTLICGCSVSM